MTKPKPFPPEAIAIFTRMLDERCSRKAWWKEHNRLHDLLKLKPWQWPCVEDPDVVHDPNNAAFAKPDPEAQWRYRELAKAANAL